MPSKSGVSRPSPDSVSSQAIRSQCTESQLDMGKSEETEISLLAETSRQTETPTQVHDRVKDEATEGGRGETLLGQTETSTQLLANSMHQDTQLINGYIGRVAAVVHSAGEGCGDTEILPNYIDSHCSGSGCDVDMGSRFASRERNFLDGNKQFLTRISSVVVSELESGIPGQFSSGQEADQRNQFLQSVADCDTSPLNVSKKTNPGELGSGQICRELFELNVTTQEEEAEDLCHSEAVAESAANNNQTPVEGAEGCPSEKAFVVEESEYHGTAAECSAGQYIPAPVETPRAPSPIIRHSPSMSTSRPRSRSTAFVRAASSRASALSAAAENAFLGRGSNDSLDKDNSDAKKTLQELKCVEGHTETKSLSEDVEAFLISEARREGHAARFEKCELEGLSRPNGQKVRKLFSEVAKTSEEIILSKPENLSAIKKDEGRDNTVVDALTITNSGIYGAAERSAKGTQDLEESRKLNHQGSLPSGHMSASTDLSYLESQEPGEESQISALNVVDKVVWLNTTGVSFDIGPNMVLEQPCVRGLQTAQAVQCLAHAAQIKNMQDNMGVYDWVDSQQDEEELSSDGKEVSGPCKVPKKLVRAPKLMKNRKRPKGFEKHVAKSAFQAGERSDHTVNKGKGMSLSEVNTKSGPDTEHTSTKALKKHQTLVTERVGNVTEGRRKQPHRKAVDGLGNLPPKYGDQKKIIKGSGKFIEREVSNCMHYLQVDCSKKRKLQDGIDNSHRHKKPSPRPRAIASDTQIAMEAMDISTLGAVAGEGQTHRKRKERNQVEILEARDWSIFEDDTRHQSKRQSKRHQRSSEARESTIISQLKGRKRVSGILEEHGQCNTAKEWNKLKDEFVKRGPQPKAQAQGLAGADRNTEELGSATNATNNDSTQGNFTRTFKSQNQKQDRRSRSLKQLMAAKLDSLDLNQQSARKALLDKGKRPLTRQQLTANMAQQDVANEVGGWKANISSLDELGMPLTSQIRKKNNNRKTRAANESKSDFIKTRQRQIRKSLHEVRRTDFNIRKRLHGLTNKQADSCIEELGSGKNATNNINTRGNFKRSSKCRKEKPDKMLLLSKQVVVPETGILDLDTCERLIMRKRPMTRQRSIINMAHQAVVNEAAENEGLITRKKPMTRQQSVINTGQQTVVNEVGGGVRANVNPSAALLFVKRNQESCSADHRKSQQCKKNPERKSVAANESMHNSLKVNEMKARTHLPKRSRGAVNNPKRLLNDGLNSPISRRTRSSLFALGSRERNTVVAEDQDSNCGQHARHRDPIGTYPYSPWTSMTQMSRRPNGGDMERRMKANETKAHKLLPKLKRFAVNNPKILHNDGVSSPISRRTRSSLFASGSRERSTVLAEDQDSNYGRHARQRDTSGTYPDQLMSMIQMSRHPNAGDRERCMKVPAVKTLKTDEGKTIQQKKKPTRSKNRIYPGFSPAVDKGRRRKREPGCVYVLFSHSLHEDTTKRQKKILAKLGGHVASSAADCTHFVADCFVRTRNMLESIAAGKVVVTSLWLECCGQAQYFIDEKNYILQDEKKEKELGFSMNLSLASAQRKPILQGMKVLVSPHTTPGFEAVKAIIESAGGQAVQELSSFSKIDATRNEIVPFVVGCQKDYEFCLPLLERGLKVYSTELILNGIVSQHLEFSRNRLFEAYIQHKHPSGRAIKFQV